MGMASTINALRVRRILGRDEWGPPKEWGPDGWAFRHLAAPASVLVTAFPGDGGDWVHASMTRDNRVPTYDDLTTLHRAVWGDGYAYQVFAPPADHVNLHAHALHLWGRADGQPVLPDFTAMLGPGVRSI